jgi:hypothetical protein
MVLEKIHFFLPRVPKLVIQLFKENHAHIAKHFQAGGDDDKVNFNNFEIELKSTYSGTASQVQLNQYLATSEQDKLTL